MTGFYAKDGQFWMDEEPMFIQAGEFHYFRTPREEWRHRLDLLKGAGFNAVACYIPWLWHQLEEGSSDLDGHSHSMRDLQGFLDLAGEMGLFIIARPGPYIMAETINEGIPPWVFSKYPQVAFIDQNGKTQNIASYLHPDFLACVKQWYKAIFGVLAPRQVSRGGRIIMVQLDNEMGMMKWVRNIMDVNPHTLSLFASHLTAAYGKKLHERYPTDDLVGFLGEGIMHPGQDHAVNIVEDYRRFYREYLQQYCSFLWTEAKENGMDALPVINIHGFMNGGKTFPIGISQLVKVMHMEGMVSATDVYPGVIGEGNFHQLLMVNEMTRAVQNKQQPLFSIEFQAGGNQDFWGSQSSLYDLHSRLCISSGMRAINHYLFFDGENDPILSPVKRHDWGHPVRKDGTLRNHYPRYAKLSSVLRSYGRDLVLSKPVTVTAIGFMLDYFMTEVNNKFSRESADILTHQREVILFDMIARGLALTHRPFSAIDLAHGSLEPAETPLCWVMMDKQCDPEIQQKLVDYLRSGGRLVLAGRICEQDFQHQDCTILKDALGIRQVNTAEPHATHSLRAFHHQDIPANFLETYSGEFDETFAFSEQGGIAGFIKQIGRGRVLLFGAAVPANTLDDIDLVNQMATRMDCSPLFSTDPWVDIRLSEGKNGRFLFINNYQDDPVGTLIKYRGETLFGGNPVQLPARRGLILPLDWECREGIKIHYLTSEITDISESGTSITLKTAQDEVNAEFRLAGFRCDQGINVKMPGGTDRLRIHGREGVITLEKI